jgi:predicted deacylase
MYWWQNFTRTWPYFAAKYQLPNVHGARSIMLNADKYPASNLPFFKSASYSSPQAGMRVLITGAVHGNEICGTHAILRVIDELDAGRINLKSGSVTFVPVTNALAYQKQQRNGDRNLNRRLRPSDEPKEFEDLVANWLCPLMQQHQVLLDLHSFRGAGQAFVMVGPENNQGQVEAFQFAKEEEAMAQCLGVHRFVDGWLSTYAKGVSRRSSSVSDHEFGMGTTEYMRSVGGYALTLECGQHDDPMAKEVAYRAILNTLRLLNVIDGSVENGANKMEGLRIYEVVDKHHENDKFSRDWASFDEITQGCLIGTRHDGTAVLAEIDGRIIFPDANAMANEEWFYLARNNNRLEK